MAAPSRIRLYDSALSCSCLLGAGTAVIGSGYGFPVPQTSYSTTISASFWRLDQYRKSSSSHSDVSREVTLTVMVQFTASGSGQSAALASSGWKTVMISPFSEVVECFGVPACVIAFASSAFWLRGNREQRESFLLIWRAGCNRGSLLKSGPFDRDSSQVAAWPRSPARQAGPTELTF